MDLKFIRENFEKVINILEKRYMHELIPIAYKIKYLDEVWRKNLKELDKLRHKRNEISKQIAILKRKNLEEEANKLINEAKELDRIISSFEKKVKDIEREIKNLLLLMPNELDPRVPIGYDESYNKPIEYKILNNFKIKRTDLDKWKNILENKDYRIYDNLPPYWELLEKFNLINTEKASKVAGSRFYYELNNLVLLDLALSLYAIDFYRKKGFIPMITPYLMKKDIESRIAYISAFEDTIFNVEDEYILIPTSEHSIVAYYMDSLIEELPIRIVAWTPAFRKESSSQQKDIKGIFRVRQFHKVELHVITDEENEEKELKNLINVFKEFIESLGISYRIIINSSGDMDRRVKIQYDLEGWFPSLGNFRELGSIGNLGKWVSTKLNIKYLDKNERKFVSNLYATGLAVQRTICSFIENNYIPEENIIKIPKVLRKYIDLDYIK